jgi:hypothetical protein
MARIKSETEAVQRSIVLPKPIDVLWSDLAQKMSLNKTSVMIVALRSLAKSEGLQERDNTEEKEAAL